MNRGSFVPLENLNPLYTYISCEWYKARHAENEPDEYAKYAKALSVLAKGFFENTTYFGFCMISPNVLHIQSWGSKRPCVEAERIMLYEIIHAAEVVNQALGNGEPLLVWIDAVQVNPLLYFFGAFKKKRYLKNEVEFVKLRYEFYNSDE